MNNHMEPTSQRTQDKYLQYILFSSAIAAICAGVYTWSLKRMFIVYVGGVLFGMLFVVPDWEYFTSRHFTEWIEPMPADEESRRLQRSRFPILKKTSKYAKREDVHVVGILFFFAIAALTVYYSWKFVTT
ncbi:hypothetical protein KP509_34G006800 [Ceratopteris richardii]|uniref:Signal peptidase complex subunit 1 n=1 Tax=Ceratopteris richardii TaxID=49495 RepID=A0A8T2QIL2_CERRI|nr:hypothetical protein KP509_34G006800 [Ceratopteris richardii]